MLKIDLAPEKYFYCQNGLILRNLLELEQELELNVAGQNMDNFNFHFFNNNNDYANWVDGVFDISDLAKNLRKVNNPSDALREVRVMLIDEAKANKELVEPVVVKPEVVEPEVENNYDKDTKKENNAEFNEKIELEKIQKFSATSEQMIDQVKTMKNKIYQKPKSLNTEIEKLEEEYVEVYKTISEERKKGVDVFIPALRLKNVKAKIGYLKAARNAEEISNIKNILETVIKEIEEAKAYNEPDLKSEVLKEAGIADSRYKIKEEN